MTELTLQPLSAAAFAPFGEVIEAQGATIAINEGSAARFHDLARLDAGPSGRLALNIFQAAPRALPFTPTVIERHPLGSQLFFPLGDQPYLVLVAPPGPVPQPDELRLFLARPGQGVNMARGVWHHPLIALFAPSSFLVLDRVGPGANCDELTLPPLPAIGEEAIRALL